MAISRPPEEPPPLEPSGDDASGPSAEEANSLTRARDKAFTAFVNRQWRSLVVFARFGLKAGDEAEDHVQDVLLRMWDDDIDGKCKGNPDCMHYWALHTLRSKAIDEFRKSKSGRVVIAEFFTALAKRISVAFSPEQHVMTREIQSHVERAIWELPERCREVFIMVRVNTMSYAETAAALQVKVSTVGPHLARAQRLLNKRLEPLGYGALADESWDVEEVAP